jgi:carboxyl-terminal processing protease
VDVKIPLVILVNNRSASASEIVSGTIQDLDRGVVMGQLTYGKGLVQNTKEIGYNARLKLTTAKYYIPSGRCIQAVRYKNGEPEHVPDSERARFKTRNGREVLDGGGVKPDVVLPAPAANALIKALDDQNILFDYVTEYCLRFDSIAGPEQFQFTEWDGFVKYLDQRKFTYKTASEEAIEKLKKEAEKENVSTTLQASIQAMESQLLAYRQQSLTENKKDIIRLIEEQIIGRYYFDKGRKQLGLRNDPEIMEAVKLLNDPVRYGNILSGK